MTDEEIEKLTKERDAWRLAAVCLYALTNEDEERDAETIANLKNIYMRAHRLSFPGNPKIPPGGPYPGFKNG